MCMNLTFSQCCNLSSSLIPSCSTCLVLPSHRTDSYTHVEIEQRAGWMDFLIFSLCPNKFPSFQGRSIHVRTFSPNPKFPCQNFLLFQWIEPPPLFSRVLTQTRWFWKQRNLQTYTVVPLLCGEKNMVKKQMKMCPGVNLHGRDNFDFRL